MKLAERLAAGDVLLTCWSGLPSADVALALAHTSYDVVTLDMQHGAHTETSIYPGIAAVTSAGKPAIVRIPVGRNDVASRAADFGAEAIIAPMINSVEDARAFAAAVKYPPIGERSWGPGRAMQLHGVSSPSEYLTTANDKVLTFAMIETRAALAVLDDILAVPGIDGVFVGPSDFSISWTNGAQVAPELDDMNEALVTIADRAREAGKYAAIFAVNPKRVPLYRSMGFSMMALGTEEIILAAGAFELIAAAR
ncbi:MAG TPA: aldolase/citrate lyase family protein [Pararhizobium sp.]|nr:aldolase/citrate lyase family protein [Pararhizobium sp.]